MSIGPKANDDGHDPNVIVHRPFSARNGFQKLGGRQGGDIRDILRGKSPWNGTGSFDLPLGHKRSARGPLCIGQCRADYFDRLDQSVRVHGLEQIFGSARVHTGFTGSGIVMRRKNDGGNANTKPTKAIQNINAGHPGHLKVEEQTIRAFQRQSSKKLVTCGVRSPRPFLPPSATGLTRSGWRSGQRIATCVGRAFMVI